MCPAWVEPDEDFYGVGGDSASFSGGDDFKAAHNNGADCDKSNLAGLDDEELFMLIKKFACNALRQLICPGLGPSITTRARGDGHEAIVQRNVSMPDVSYYSEVLDSLGPYKRSVIESYGFGGPMLFDRCAIPLPFARWVADHVEVRSSEIVVKNKSIPLSPEIVADVLGIPIGGRKFSKKDSELGKIDFLSAIRSTTLPGIKSFGDNLLRDDLSNDETVRSFLVVALVTFLCPCSSLIPSKEYLAALVDPSTANEWDWASLVHYWYLKHIRKYNGLKNKVVDSSIPLGGCLYVLCVVYLDSLVLGHEQLPFTLPRVCVWKGDMIKDNANLDCVEGDTYGKLPILPQKDTWYGKRISRSFKKAVVESVDGYLNVETLDAITTLYTKHTSTSSSLPPHLVQNIIIDVVSLLHQRATTNIISQSDQLGVDGPKNVSIRPDACTTHGNNVGIEGVGSADIRGERLGTHEDATCGLEKNGQVHTAVPDGRDVNTPLCSNTAFAGTPRYDGSFDGNNISPTQIVQSSSNDMSIGPHVKRRRLSNSPSMNINEGTTQNVSGRTRSRLSPLANAGLVAVDNPEAILRKKNKDNLLARLKEVCQSLRNECIATTNDDLNLDKHQQSAQVADNGLEHMLRGTVNVHQSGCSRGTHPPTTSAPQMHVISPAHLLADDTTTPSARETVHTQSKHKMTPANKINMTHDDIPTFRLLDDSDDLGNFITDPQKERATGLSCDGNTFHTDSIVNKSVPVGIFDVGCARTRSYVPQAYQTQSDANMDHNNKCVSNYAANSNNAPVFDVTPSDMADQGHDVMPNPIPLSAVDCAGHVLVVSSQEPPDVIITEEANVNASVSSMSREACQLHNGNASSCFKKCQKIGFNLGSSSSGNQSRRPRRLIKPNSYLRDFQVNVCKYRISAPIPDRLAFETLQFYANHYDYARRNVINYGNVYVTYQELGSSMRRSEKVPVHHHVINAFCCKLFKDKHPRYSKRHYFFSPVGDYLMNHEGNPTHLFDNCKRSFSLANGCFKFTSSDYLFFPICHDTHWFVFVVAIRDGYFVFLDSFFGENDPYQKEVRSIIIQNFVKAWDDFVGDEWNFDEFVIHYAPVPKQDRRFLSK